MYLQIHARSEGLIQMHKRQRPAHRGPAHPYSSLAAGDLCMTGLFAVTNAVCKVARGVLILILVHCGSCAFILRVLGCIGRLGGFRFSPARRQSFPRLAPHLWLTTSGGLALPGKPGAPTSFCSSGGYPLAR